MKKLVLAAALLLCAAAPAAAQEEPSPGEVQAVREFLEVTRVREMLPRTMEAMFSGALGEQLPPGFADILREFMAEHFRYELLEPGYIRVYTELFTEDELRALVAFYRTPAGQRFVELTPEIVARTQEITSEIMEDATPELMQLMMERMDELEEPAAPKSPAAPRKS